jgi:hypothetical protein
MRGISAIVGLLVVLGGGYFVYHSYLTRTGAVQAPPQEQIDVIDIKSNLLLIGQAERQYVALHGTYATIEQLQQEGPSAITAEARGYRFAVTVDGSRAFTVTAAPTDPGKAGWPTLTIDDTMQVTTR